MAKGKGKVSRSTIAEGREDWQKEWARLDSPKRRELSRVVNRGAAVDDAVDAPLAAGYARRLERLYGKAQWVFPPFVFLSWIGLVAVTGAVAKEGMGAILTPAPLIPMVGVPAMCRYLYLPKYRRAAAANTALVSANRRRR